MQAEILPNISSCYPQSFKAGPSIATDFSGLILCLKYFLPLLKVKIIHFPFPGCPSKWPKVTSETKEFINRDFWFLWKVWKEDTRRNAWPYKVMCLRNITESKITRDKSVNREINIIWEIMWLIPFTNKQYMYGRNGSAVVSSGCTRGQIQLHASASPVTGCPMPCDDLHRPHAQNERYTCRQNSHTLMIKHRKTNNKTKKQTQQPYKMCNPVSKESEASAWRTGGRCLKDM